MGKRSYIPELAVQSKQGRRKESYRQGNLQMIMDDPFLKELYEKKHDKKDPEVLARLDKWCVHYLNDELDYCEEFQSEFMDGLTRLCVAELKRDILKLIP